MNEKLIGASLFAVLLLLAASAPALADGGFFPDSVHRDLYESAQKAVILYSNSTEHLILSVSFEGDAENFGWVIPVPNKPEIAVADARLLRELSHLTATGFRGGRAGSSVLAAML